MPASAQAHYDAPWKTAQRDDTLEQSEAWSDAMLAAQSLRQVFRTKN